MAKLYVGDSQGAPAIVKIEEVPKTKFGCAIDNILGGVDTEGKYVASTDEFLLDLTGVKIVDDYSMQYTFRNTHLRGVVATDLEYVGLAGMLEVFSGAYFSGDAVFGISEITSYKSAFDSAFRGTTWENGAKPCFINLKKISSNGAFNDAFKNMKGTPFVWDDVFPALEEVSGDTVFDDAFYNAGTDTIVATKLKKIIGGSSYYYATLYGSSSIEKYYFPNVQEITNNVFYGSREIHFAAANQAAIEACDGYDSKWGATKATIYFDL